MPKVKRRRGKAKTHITVPASRSAPSATATEHTGVVRQRVLRRTQSTQSVIMDAVVALGFWGLAVSFAFFMSDANRLLFAAMCALTALIWTYRFGMRLHRSLQQSK